MKTQIKKLLSAFAALTMAAGFYVPAVQADGAAEFTAYDNFANLDFENAGYSTWDPGSKITVITDGTGNEAPQSGHKAISVNGDKSYNISIWGGTTSAPDGFLPAAGDLISGTFWMKMMTEKDGNWYPSSVGWRLPKVRLYMLQNETQVDLAVTKDVSGENARNVAICAPYTWTEIEIDSTGTAYDGVSPLTWEITTGIDTGSPFMIDNVQFGTTSRAPEASVTPEDATAVFDLLQFENGTLGSSSGSISLVVNNSDKPANKGIGAAYFDGRNGQGYSLWGGGNNIPGAQPGSTISGTAALKLQQPKYDTTEPNSNWYKFPSIVIKRASDKVVLAKFDPMTVVYNDIVALEWFEVQIVSTGETFSENDVLEYAVEKTYGSGIEGMLDSITLTVTAPAPAVDPVTFTATQAQAVGSTIRFVTTASIAEAVDSIGVKIAAASEKEFDGEFNVDNFTGDVEFVVDITNVPDGEKDTQLTATPYYTSGADRVFGDDYTTTFNTVIID